MPLSHCSNCKYYSQPIHSTDIACTIQPAYASMWQRLTGLDEYSQNCLPIDDCLDFETHPNLTPIEITLSLTSKQWHDLAINCPIPQLIEAISPHINLDSYAWIELDSSCISAIAYNIFDSQLKIRFLQSGSIYQYSGVSLDTFNELLNASSQGRYFNRYIKEHYPTQLISN